MSLGYVVVRTEQGNLIFKMTGASGRYLFARYLSGKPKDYKISKDDVVFDHMELEKCVEFCQKSTVLP